MPYLSDAELSRELSRVEPSQAIERSNGTALEVVPLLGGMTAAAAMGFLRAKFEDPSTGQWNIPGTKWDAECVAFLACASVAFGGQYLGLGEYRSYAAVGAMGIGFHLAGELGRGFGKTGKLSFHVGGPRIGDGGVPPWDPSSFDPTQYAAPYDDDAARGLAASGV